MNRSGTYFCGVCRGFGLAAILLSLYVPGYGQNASAATSSRKLPSIMACESLADSRNDEIIQEAGVVSGILEELAAERQRFIAKGDPADLFPTLYFHVSRIEFAHVLANDADVRPEMLDMIITFYDAYRSNRDAFDKGGRGAVESHWKSYYKGAVEARKTGSRSMGTVVGLALSGIDAHLKDLSRTIRYEFDRAPDKKNAVIAAYYSSDPIFADAARLINDDIVEGMHTAPTLRSLDSTFKFGETYVIHARHRAMELALSGNKLKTKKPQPKLAHSRTSRSYFSVQYIDAPCP